MQIYFFYDFKYQLTSSNWFHLCQKRFSSLKCPLSLAITDLIMAQNAGNTHSSSWDLVCLNSEDIPWPAETQNPPQRLVQMLQRLCF